MRWGVNWQLVTGERKKKSLWSFPPSSASSLLLTVKSNSFFFLGMQNLWVEVLSAGEEGWRFEPGLVQVKRGQSLLNLLAHHVGNLRHPPPPTSLPLLLPSGLGSTRATVGIIHLPRGFIALLARLFLYQRGHTGEDAWSLSDENTHTHTTSSGVKW